MASIDPVYFALRNLDVAKLSSSNTHFAVDLYQRLCRDTDGNVFFSPCSIFSALAMVYLGARGETQAQMKEALHFTDVDESNLHSALKKLNSVFGETEGPNTVKLANRLFGEKSKVFLEEFLKETERYYNAKLKPVDFVGQPGQARQIINSWVEEQTEGKIKDLIREGILGFETTLVLVNAIYFKGVWESKFKDRETKEDNFHITINRKVRVPMMNQKGAFNHMYDEDLNCQILELPYLGGDLSMLIVLPTEIEGLERVEKGLQVEKLGTGLASNMGKTNLKVAIPKFKLEDEFVLNTVLATMGMNDLFDDDKANLSGISSSNDLSVSLVVHKSFVQVDEKGTKATAATAVVVRTKSMSFIKPKPKFDEFIADHPFLFFIRENRSCNILFMGRYCDPTVTGGDTDSSKCTVS